MGYTVKSSFHDRGFAMFELVCAAIVAMAIFRLFKVAFGMLAAYIYIRIIWWGLTTEVFPLFWRLVSSLNPF